MLLLVVLCAASTFWYVSSRITERATTEQVEQTLDETQRTALAELGAAADDVDRSMDALVSVSSDTTFRGAQLTMFRALTFAPELSGVFIADSDGTFNYVFRTDAGFGTKLIEPATDTRERRVRLTTHHADFTEVDREEVPGDRYDPRTRPWFTAAVDEPGTRIWTDAYTFFTSQQPGITQAQSSPNGDWVVGVDLELASFVQLLESLSQRSAGEVFVYDPVDQMALTGNGLVDLAQSPTVQDARLRATLEASTGKLSQGLAAFEYESLGQRHSASVVPLTVVAPNNNWLLVTDISDGDVPVAISGLVRTLQLLGLGISTLAGLACAMLLVPTTRRMTMLQRQANVDPLTALPNRRAILHTGEMVASSGSLAAVAMIDVDRFKYINDTYGHEVGDQTLQGIAAVFVDSGCQVGRLGGEEFVMLIEDPGLAESHLAEMLRAAVELVPVETSAGPIPVTVSIGVAAHANGDDFNQTLRRADGAMLEAKLNGRNRVVAVGRTGGKTLSLR